MRGRHVLAVAAAVALGGLFWATAGDPTGASGRAGGGERPSAGPSAPGGEAAGSGAGGAAAPVVRAAGGRPETAPRERAGVATPDDTARATFAGGCFWCMEPPFDELEGVLSTTSGYTGGDVEDPTYEQVTSGTTGHRESVRVAYDPDRVSYSRLLEAFWTNVDPTDPNGQFCDRGPQYATAIFYHDAEQEELARRSKEALEENGRIEESIVTEIRPAGRFYPAEAYHQDFYREHPLRYKFYRTSCGRDRVLRDLWGGWSENLRRLWEEEGAAGSTPA